MTTCRGCGALFTEGHDETRCELIAQSLADRREFLEKESAYLDQVEALAAERDSLAAKLSEIRRVWGACGGWPDTTAEKEELRVAIEGKGV